ncbi:MAG: hypothetical protein LC658_02915 [Bacteroidales bacterium]|nr:hypothetical protein [Bacteroidales bacterium]
MDYLNVGANGFAQVGDENYYAKNKIEMKHLLELIRDKFPIPEQLDGLCHFAVKSFPHDFGTYHEIVLHFDDITINDDYDEEDNGFPFISEEELKECFENNTPVPQSPMTLHDTFWDWFQNVESYNLETEEITEKIKTKYLASLNMEEKEHFTVKRA